MATSVTFLTGLSLAATATNMHIGGGGAYYIISRSLGLEIGSAIGVPLFLAQSIGVAFYISGFSEAFTQVIPVDNITALLPFACIAGTIRVCYHADPSGNHCLGLRRIWHLKHKC
jgi:amino acid transporter